MPYILFLDFDGVLHPYPLHVESQHAELPRHTPMLWHLRASWRYQDSDCEICPHGRERDDSQLPQQDEVVVQLRKAIARALREGEPDIDRISAQLGASARTLQRRLKDDETSFRQELNVVRYELAQSYLRDPRLQLAGVAILLGYSEQSTFNRAFRHWSGRTPREVRAD